MPLARNDVHFAGLPLLSFDETRKELVNGLSVTVPRKVCAGHASGWAVSSQDSPSQALRFKQCSKTCRRNGKTQSHDTSKKADVRGGAASLATTCWAEP